MPLLVRKKQITYYLGAGASHNAIPVVENLLTRISSLTKYLEKKTIPYNNINVQKKNYRDLKKLTTLQVIIHEFNWLLEECSFHQTIDTLAKKYFIQGKKEWLVRLKRALFVYFYLEQNINFPTIKLNPEIKNQELEIPEYQDFVDKRYDDLIANLADRENDEIKLKDHVKILTWNYDMQIELALKVYLEGETFGLNKIKSSYQIHPNHHTNQLEKGESLDLDRFATIKLNGNAFIENQISKKSIINKSIYDLRPSNARLLEDDILKYFLDFYYNFLKGPQGLYKDYYSLFNFAFEGNKVFDGQKHLLSEASKIMKATDVLIIIGYSFPFFNSSVDKNLLLRCNAKEIIIQDYKADEIKSRLTLLAPNFAQSKISKVPPGKYFPIYSET